MNVSNMIVMCKSQQNTCSAEIDGCIVCDDQECWVVDTGGPPLEKRAAILIAFPRLHSRYLTFLGVDRGGSSIVFAEEATLVGSVRPCCAGVYPCELFDLKSLNVHFDCGETRCVDLRAEPPVGPQIVE